MARTRSRPAHRSLKVGDQIVVRIGGGERRGVVVEDRGPLGVDGRQIVAVRVGGDDYEHQFEARADDLEFLSAA
ncbi:MAG: hypothetical protein ACRDK4_09785 [Solirubrobacteraceae bacterium]